MYSPTYIEVRLDQLKSVDVIADDISDQRGAFLSLILILILLKFVQLTAREGQSIILSLY